MVTILLLAGVFVGLLLTAYFSGSETGVYCLNPIRVMVEAERDVPGARRLAHIIRRQDETVIGTLIGANVADYIVTVCVAALVLRAADSPHQAELYTTAIVTPLVLVFGNVLPKDYARRYSQQVMRWTAPPLLALNRVLRWSGVIWLVRHGTSALMQRLDPDRVRDSEHVFTRARMLSMLREGAVGGGLSLYQQDLIDRIMSLSKVTIGTVMIPHERAATISIDMPREDFLRIARMAHFARYPVWDGHPRRVVGAVAVIDMITDPGQQPIRSHVRQAVHLPESLSVTGALLRLQESRQPMAVVVNRAGDAVGILTVKDLVEEIVGDLDVW